jgi:hypothetical protein
MRLGRLAVLTPGRRAFCRALNMGLMVAAWMASDCSEVHAQAPERPSEYQIKAAFLCKFGNFVQWPPESLGGSSDAFVIGVAGDDRVTEEVSKACAGLQVEGRPIVVRMLRRGDPIVGVHLLFVARSDDRYLREWLTAARPLPVLTVTESDAGLALGSIINFVVADNKVRFDVAPPPSDRTALKVDSRLLGVARKVVRATS